MDFKERILAAVPGPLHALGIEVLQVNLGYRCNMSCKHCHVGAGPDRDEIMPPHTIEEILRVLKESAIKTLDITGGAPELNPGFRHLVKQARERDCHVISRSNLTVFYEPGMEDLFEFYRSYNVEIIASLPSYSRTNAERVRGAGTFDKSIAALQKLNSLGYGATSAMKLNLVYNPGGAFLPSAQGALEEEYRRELKKNFGITFHCLYTFANMPIGRFREFLMRSGNFDAYMKKLHDAFNPETLPGIMCRRIVNVGWDGSLYDCDFNQMTGLRVLEEYPRTLGDFDPRLLATRRIAVDNHCYGCTAGQGSS